MFSYLMKTSNFFISFTYQNNNNNNNENLFHAVDIGKKVIDCKCFFSYSIFVPKQGPESESMSLPNYLSLGFLVTI